MLVSKHIFKMCKMFKKCRGDPIDLSSDTALPTGIFEWKFACMFDMTI